MNRYASSLDKLSRIITWSVFALGVAIAAICFFGLKGSGDNAQMVVFYSIGLVLLFSLVIAMYLLKPLAVVINNSGLTIERKLAPVVIGFPEIKSIRIAANGEMKGVIRTFGDGGLFGYMGLYYSKKPGSMNWYCTQRKNYVLIEKTNNKKIVVTPDDPDAFLHEIQLIKPALVSYPKG